MSIGARVSGVVGWSAGVATGLAVLTHEFRFTLASSVLRPGITARHSVVAIDKEWSSHFDGNSLDEWDALHFGSIDGHLRSQFEVDGGVGVGTGSLHTGGGKISVDTSSPPASGGVAGVVLLESSAVSVQSDLGDTMWISSGVAEQVWRSAVWILMGACGAWSVAVHLIGVRVGESVAVHQVREGSHWGVAEVLPVGASWVVGRVGLLAEPSWLLELAPEFPEVVDERVVHEEDWLVGRSAWWLHVSSNPEMNVRVRILNGSVVVWIWTTWLRSSVGQRVLNRVLSDDSVDLVLIEKLSLGSEISQNCRSTLNSSPVSEWSSDDISIVVGSSNEQVREHDRVSWVRKVRVHNRVPVWNENEWVNHTKSDLESLEVFSVPWKESWSRMGS